MKYYETPDEVFEAIHGQSSSDRSERKWNKGYTNYANGFIDAERSMKTYYERAKSFSSIEFVFREVVELLFQDGTTKAKGVSFVDGDSIESDLVIVAAGAWSCKLVNLENVCKSTSIEVAWYKVTPEEENQWKSMSITTNLSTGINIFPPYNGEIKTLRRSPGYKNTVEVQNPNPIDSGSKIIISYPRTIMTNPSDWIPEDAEKAIRENLKEIMPPLYDRPFDRTKLCWLTQTPSANFLIDKHPMLENVVMATGGSAHAWKFVPIIGDKVVDYLTGNLDPVVVME